MKKCEQEYVHGIACQLPEGHDGEHQATVVWREIADITVWVAGPVEKIA